MSTPPAIQQGFECFGLSDAVLRSILALGWTEPTQVQRATIPEILAGRDVVVQSRTGTGKTGAFGIPIIERIDLERLEPQALVLCPTRELALQVSNDIAALGKSRGVKVFPIYGGASMRQQIDHLRAGLHVVVGTPGRLLDHLRSRQMSLARVRFLVLDEADEMLSMGFFEEVSRILEMVPRERETMLFSATLAPGVEGLIYRHQKDPARITLSSATMLVEEVDHAYYVTPTMDKPRNLARILLHEEPRNAIIFVNTRDEARSVTGSLKHEGFEVAMLSGELSQKDRERTMRDIKMNRLRFMVATDVAARGIDISDLSHVIHYSVPENRDVYVHRCGRTGRIGKSGTVITLVGLRDLPRWGHIEGIKGLTPEERKLPTEEEILEKQVDRVIFAVRHLEAGTAPDDTEPPASLPQPEERYLLAAERLIEQGVAPRMLALLLEKALTPPPTVLEIAAPPPATTDAAPLPSDVAPGAAGAGPQRKRHRRRR